MCCVERNHPRAIERDEAFFVVVLIAPVTPTHSSVVALDHDGDRAATEVAALGTDVHRHTSIRRIWLGLAEKPPNRGAAPVIAREPDRSDVVDTAGEHQWIDRCRVEGEVEEPATLLIMAGDRAGGLTKERSVSFT